MKEAHPHRLTDPAAILKFATGGNARLTLVSLKTGTRFTYRIRRKDDSTPFFVALLTGQSNETDYQYMGYIGSNLLYCPGRKSTIDVEAPSSMGFMFFWATLRLGKVHPRMEVWHEGRCCRCGRVLTVPGSIEDGIGPECALKA